MNDSAERNNRALRRATEIAVRLALLAGLTYACWLIFRPFATPVLLAVVIAVALHKPYALLRRGLGERSKLAAALFILVGLAVLIAPTVWAVSWFIQGAQTIAATLNQQEIHIPPPPAGVADWPIVGPQLHAWWSATAADLSQTLTKLAPHLADVGVTLAGVLAQTGVVIAQVVLAIIVAGVLLARERSCRRAALAVGRRLGGEAGEAAVTLAAATIHTVARGVVGVAMLQAAMAGAAMHLAGVPAAGVLTVAVLILTVAQLTSLLVLAPAWGYLLAAGAGAATLVLFAVWTVFITIIDEPMRAYFFSRGVDIPMAVIMIGALGGVLWMGILGLFMGAVILAVAHTLFVAWVKAAASAADPDAAR